MARMHTQPHAPPPRPHANYPVYSFSHNERRWVTQEARSAELREKFETAVPSIQEKLKVEAERRQQQRQDNEDLRGKLASFAEQAKLRCARQACKAQRGLMLLLEFHRSIVKDLLLAFRSCAAGRSQGPAALWRRFAVVSFSLRVAGAPPVVGHSYGRPPLSHVA